MRSTPRTPRLVSRRPGGAAGTPVRTLACTLACGLLAVAASAAPARAQAPRVPPGQVTRLTAGWPKASRDAIAAMTQKYGGPAAVTGEVAVWGRTGPWKRTVVYAREVTHEFPMHHTDVMQQWVDYKAPAAVYDELAQYDGSVVFERTAGEASARCDKEGANLLALNLAHEIVTGKRGVQDARAAYGEQIMAMKAGRPAPYTERLMFTPPANAGDPDQPLARTSAAGSGR